MDKFISQLRLREWTCSNCCSVFYTHEHDSAFCPICGVPAVRCGEVDFLVRNRAFEDLMENIVEQECSEGCWVYEEGITADNVEEVEAVVDECAIALLRRVLYGSGCPVKESGGLKLVGHQTNDT